MTVADAVTPAKSKPQARRPSPSLAPALRAALLGTAHVAQIGIKHGHSCWAGLNAPLLHVKC